MGVIVSSVGGFVGLLVLKVAESCLIGSGCNESCLIGSGCTESCFIGSGCTDNCLIGSGCTESCLIGSGVGGLRVVLLAVGVL